MKHLVRIEFRYHDAPDKYREKVVTIGVYESFQDACDGGNAALERMEKRFPAHRYPDGQEAPRERFSLNGGAFGTKRTLVTNMANLRTPFAFFAQIEPLDETDLDGAIDDVVAAVKRHRAAKQDD